jgi:hypothetical protein
MGRFDLSDVAKIRTASEVRIGSNLLVPRYECKVQLSARNFSVAKLHNQARWAKSR